MRQRVVQFTRHAVALAADGQLFEGRGVMRQFAVGLFEVGTLLAKAGHDAGNDVTRNQEGKGTDKQQAMIGIGKGEEVRLRVAHQAMIQHGSEDAVEHHRLEIILPGNQHQRNKEKQEQLPGGFLTADLSHCQTCIQKDVLQNQRKDCRVEYSQRKVKPSENFLQGGNRKIDQQQNDVDRPERQRTPGTTRASREANAPARSRRREPTARPERYERVAECQVRAGNSSYPNHSTGTRKRLVSGVMSKHDWRHVDE